MSIANATKYPFRSVLIVKMHCTPSSAAAPTTSLQFTRKLRMKAFVAALAVAQTAWGSEVRGRALAPLAVTTTAGTTHYISACGSFPPVDPGLTVTPGATDSLTSATAAITAGGQTTDALDVNPDPHVVCSFERTCSPCPGLTVTGTGGATVTISGAGTTAAYQACMQRVIFRSTAFGGQEGLGDRTITFTVNDAAGAATATKTVTYDAADDAACSAALNANSVFFTNDAPAGFYPVPYDAACSGGPCDAVLIAPFATVTAGSSGLVGRARLFYNTFTRGESPGTPVPAEDRFGFLPDAADAASTPGNPCPGLGYRRLTDANGFAGMEVYGPASPAVYTACVRRAFYADIAPAGTATLGQRPTALRVFAITTAYSEQFAGPTIPVKVNAPATAGVCSTAGTAACIGPAPTDAQVDAGLPAQTPVPGAPSPSPAAGGASPSPVSGGASASSTPHVGNGAIGGGAVTMAGSAVAALLIGLAMRDAFRA